MFYQIYNIYPQDIFLLRVYRVGIYSQGGGGLSRFGYFHNRGLARWDIFLRAKQVEIFSQWGLSQFEYNTLGGLACLDILK